MSAWCLGLSIPLDRDSNILFMVWKDSMPHEGSLKRKVHPLCQPNAAFILSIREPLHSSHLQSIKTPMEHKAYSIGSHVGSLEGGMDEDMADFSRELGGHSIEYGNAAGKLTFSPN